MSTPTYRIGIDVGGTFTDVVAIRSDGVVVLEKTPTTPRDQSDGVLDGINRIATAEGFDSTDAVLAATTSIVHGTTTGDNTMIQMSGAPTGLIVTEGFRDEIELRRCFKEDIWDPALGPPEPIAKRRVRLEVPERMTAEGEVDIPLDEDAVRAAVRRLRAFGVTSIAIVFLHSYLNPAHELRGTRDRPRGVPRRRARLAVARGLPEASRVRAHVDDARERVRGPTDRPVPRSARAAPARRGLRPRAADRHLGRWRRDPGRDRPPRGRDHRFRSDRRGRRREPSGHRRRARRRRERRHGWDELRRLPHPGWAARAQQRLELAAPLLHRAPDGRHPRRRRREVARSPGSTGRRCGSVRSPPARSRAPPATAGAVRARRSPTPT